MNTPVCVTAPCKLRNIAVVVDSTRYLEEPMFEILTRHLPTYFFADLKKFAGGMETKVSSVVYFHNNNCHLNRTLRPDEAVPPTSGDQEGKKL